MRIVAFSCLLCSLASQGAYGVQLQQEEEKPDTSIVMIDSSKNCMSGGGGMSGSMSAMGAAMASLFGKSLGLRKDSQLT